MIINKKIPIIFILILFFLLGFTLKINPSADDEIKGIKYLKEGVVSHIEVITPKNVRKIALEAVNHEKRLTHFFVLENYLSKETPLLRKNIFYITNKAADLEEIDELIFVSSGNIRIPVEIEEVEEEVEEEEIEMASEVMLMEYVSDGGSVNTLKIMSYNIHHGRNLFGKYSLDEIAEVIKKSGAEIIGLQELDNGVVRSRFEDQIKYLSEKLSMEYVYGYNVNLLGGKYGNGILSKYPIESYENFHLPSGRERRGLLTAVIDVKGKKINFLVTHLGLNQQERQNQVNAIEKYMDTISDDVILVGDFNAKPKSKEIQLISKRLIDAAYATGKDEEPTFDLPVLSARIDYIFTHKNLRPLKYDVIKSRASDHYPITATIKIQ
ncbi:endonuclease/exonuclease/phosphatase [Clostridium aceticum]|uniref:Endonuclease/exonuclease/phosphatase n=1 Tax=Clostridium aceticum TaxID=84022 RepID=A0A0G3WAU4_9CLOT|nr:endonuclease/exonuclease/phosphatase family protein [Clostridium aceticum]AKL95796.1 endonuclease/exonuclease/phosphatase [Clostridium aceticum]